MIFAKGVMSIAKYRSNQRDLVYVHLGIMRIPKYEVDILMIHNNAFDRDETEGGQKGDQLEQKRQIIEKCAKDEILLDLHDRIQQSFTSLRLLQPSLFAA